jgi:uncharacterized LabA/DUF88 family protein
MPASDKIALFIDGANFNATAKTLGFNVDFKRLLKEFQSRGTLLRAFYYTATIEDKEYSPIRSLIDWLDHNGYTVVTKVTKEFIDPSGRRTGQGPHGYRTGGQCDGTRRAYRSMVLFSGNGAFRSLVKAMQRRGGLDHLEPAANDRR